MTCKHLYYQFNVILTNLQKLIKTRFVFDCILFNEYVKVLKDLDKMKTSVPTLFSDSDIILFYS